MTIELADGPLYKPENASFGGMRADWNGTAWCHFGWSVRNVNSGVTGVASAGHCAGQNGIKHPGYSIHAAEMVIEHQGSYGEVGWWTTPKDEPALFYADVGGETRQVESAETLSGMSLGEWVCIYSREQQMARCTTVGDPYETCGHLGRMVLMTTDVTVPGDSGAGWSYGTKAFGTHSGDCGSVSMFSPVYYHELAIAVKVRLSP